jgi:acyl-CoA dehydrogenase
MSISCTTTRAALLVRRRDFGSETFWSDKIGAPYAKVGPDAPWTSLSASKYAA